MNITLGKLIIDEEKRCYIVPDSNIEKALTPVQIKIIAYLLPRSNQAVKLHDLYIAVRGEEAVSPNNLFFTQRTFSVHLMSLRKMLSLDDSRVFGLHVNELYIYFLNCPIEQTAPFVINCSSMPAVS